MRRYVTVLFVLAVVAVVAQPVLAAKLTGAPQGGRLLTATLSGAEEVPGPGDPTASGSFVGTFNRGQRQICYELTYQGTTAVAAHIHRGAAGVAGDIVVTLQTPATGSAKECVTASRELIGEIITNPGGFYVNVHSAEFPQGAARGQLSK
jgi:hypothetical protein